jgi:hypothetical protein
VLRHGAQQEGGCVVRERRGCVISFFLARTAFLLRAWRLFATRFATAALGTATLTTTTLARATLAAWSLFTAGLLRLAALRLWRTRLALPVAVLWPLLGGRGCQGRFV